ncbi:head vertex assembly chaperone [Acinetobacter phage Acj9]|uniref:Gp40 membrane-associated initiation of head vertex protein n=1 Tax=Acinetobacter phage Acj9 TaxID=760939 RepID=E5EPM0_9CAUD|nr:head vertex assembly chaperone [Acinetobacter phage Acj9]ADG59986.1 gp40 membrane-associated initiation of head vertex protein [Acinetobacter phage Acj9]
MRKKTKTEVQVQGPGDALFNKSFDIVKESMKDVKQEILITLEDGSNHIVYLHDAKLSGKELTVDFSTFDEDRKPEIGEAVKACLQAQFTHSLARPKKRFSF